VPEDHEVICSALERFIIASDEPTDVFLLLICELF
jgi:hypothetical protein